MEQIFDMAVAEGLIQRNPALLLFTPREAKKPMRWVITMKEVQICFGVPDHWMGEVSGDARCRWQNQ